MPSSFSFLLNSQSSSSSSSSEKDSKSDQSDDDDDHINISYYKKRTIQNDNDMLERPSDQENSGSETDDSDHDETEHNLFTSSNNPGSYILTRQLTLYDDDWPKQSSNDENKFRKSMHRNDTLFMDSNQHQLVSMFFLI
jgi:hypothetical protein